MVTIYIILLTFVTHNDVSSLGLRNESLIEHATFDTLDGCESALVNYALQAEPILHLQQNQRGTLEAYTSAKKGSNFKVSCLRIILPDKNNMHLS